MEYRFRQMRIAAGHLEDFAREWTEQVLPLRTEAGFVTHSAWLCEDGTFLWLLGHPGDFATADGEYYDSADRRSMVPDPARFIEGVVERSVLPAGGVPSGEEHQAR